MDALIDINDLDLSGAHKRLDHKPGLFDIEIVLIGRNEAVRMTDFLNILVHEPEIDITPGLMRRMWLELSAAPP